MTELLKDKYYNYNSLNELAARLKNVYHSFQAEKFVSDIMVDTWNDLELKARVRRISINLGKYLPAEYEQAVGIIDKVIESYPAGYNDYSLVYFPDYVELCGQGERYWDLSMSALERYTICSTAEFAVRPFILSHDERMMRQMSLWAKHENEHVRRLASEGCRPQLPWGQALPGFKNDPSPVIGILEQLKADPSLYVRKSVANNLNDISKTHPDLVVKIASEWYGKNEHTDWIVKHGCRTLLKKGNRDALSIFGFAGVDCIIVDGFKLGDESISIGENMTFYFKVKAKKTARVRLEYGIDYLKANGKRNRKIFQISEMSLNENQEKTYMKTHAFANLSTRSHYPGIHSITLIVNGDEIETLDFELLPAKSVTP